MPYKILPRSVLWLAGLVSASVLAGPLVFRPAAGSTLTKSFNQDWKIHLDRLRVTVDGRDFLWTFFAGLYLDMALHQRVTITDTYDSVRRGEPIALDRSFDVLTEDFEITLGGVSRIVGEWREEDTVVGESKLEDSVAQFRCGPDGITKAFDPLVRTDLDEALLEGLSEDMDLRALLPDRVVHVGDAWDIDLASLPDLLSPGGSLSWDVEDGGSGVVSILSTPEPALMGDLRHVLGDLLVGDATVTYVCEEDGLSWLDLEIQVETIAGTGDLADLASTILDEMLDAGSFEVEELCLHFVLNASGTARWDTERGHISNLELTGELQSAMELALLWDLGELWVIGIETDVSSEFAMKVDTE